MSDEQLIKNTVQHAIHQHERFEDNDTLKSHEIVGITRAEAEVFIGIEAQLHARIGQLNERVGELEGLLLDAMTQGCSDVEGEFDTGAISTWRDIGECLVKSDRLTHSRPGAGRRMFYKLKEQP